MDNFNINLTINDVCCNKCNRSSNGQTLNITDSSTIIPLQNDFSFRIISATNNRVIMEIRKSYLRFIRFGYINVPINLLLPTDDCWCEHYITIKINSIVAN